MINQQVLSANTTSGSGLQFFPTSEGYFDTINQKYVFQYKDHLGNVRVSYAKKTQTQVLEIIEENNYYPFGLKHKGYNSNMIGVENKYKYQGQERQDELGLNWDSFKWRNYDYAIGRFMSIDPLSEKYVHNGVYNFSENRVIDGRELEGLEWQNFRTTFSNPGSLSVKLPSATAQKQHYSVTIENAKKTFSDFKSDFKEKPQDFLTNSKATFNSPVDGDGESSDFKKGSFIKIDINGPMNNSYVKVTQMKDEKEKLTTTFSTMEGHIEKGKISFRLQENKDGSIKFSIDSQSEVDMGLAPEQYSRDQQKQSWNEVLTNISKYLGGKETKRESKVVEPQNKK